MKHLFFLIALVSIVTLIIPAQADPAAPGTWHPGHKLYNTYWDMMGSYGDIQNGTSSVRDADMVISKSPWNASLYIAVNGTTGAVTNNTNFTALIDPIILNSSKYDRIVVMGDINLTAPINFSKAVTYSHHGKGQIQSGKGYAYIGSPGNLIQHGLKIYVGEINGSKVVVDGDSTGTSLYGIEYVNAADTEVTVDHLRNVGTGFNYSSAAGPTAYVSGNHMTFKVIQNTTTGINASTGDVFGEGNVMWGGGIFMSKVGVYADGKGNFGRIHGVIDNQAFPNTKDFVDRSDSGGWVIVTEYIRGANTTLKTNDVLLGYSTTENQIGQHLNITKANSWTANNYGRVLTLDANTATNPAIAVLAGSTIYALRFSYNGKEIIIGTANSLATDATPTEKIRINTTSGTVKFGGSFQKQASGWVCQYANMTLYASTDPDCP